MRNSPTFDKGFRFLDASSEVHSHSSLLYSPDPLQNLFLARSIPLALNLKHQQGGLQPAPVSRLRRVRQFFLSSFISIKTFIFLTTKDNSGHTFAQRGVININNGVLSVSAYSSYEWYRSPDRVSFIASGSAQQENANDNEYYYVFVTDLNGCTVSSDTILYQDPNDLSEHGFPATLSIYPNPFENVLNIKFKSKTSEKARLKLFDDTGRLIYSGELENDKINFIDLSEYASGIYQLLFSINGMNYPQKILKK